MARYPDYGPDPHPRLPKPFGPVAVFRPGGLCPDTVALPSPNLTGFPHFHGCFETLPAVEAGGVKERP
jgi:hypothetical protein